jgi:hypothetical protein
MNPGTKEALANGCRCGSVQPEDPNTWAIAVGCPLHDNLPIEIREKLLEQSRKSQAELRGVTEDDEWD